MWPAIQRNVDCNDVKLPSICLVVVSFSSLWSLVISEAATSLNQKRVFFQQALWWKSYTMPFRSQISRGQRTYYPKNPDPSKMAILRTPKTPLLIIQVHSPFHWKVQPGILRVVNYSSNSNLFSTTSWDRSHLTWDVWGPGARPMEHHPVEHGLQPWWSFPQPIWKICASQIGSSHHKWGKNPNIFKTAT